MYDTNAEVIEERGNYRARIVHDTYPNAPEFEAGDPIFDLTDGSLVYGGTEPREHGSVAAVAEALDKTRADRYSWRGEWDHETFERYVRIFHGGSVTWLSGGYREGTRYAAIALPEFRKAHGCPDDLLAGPAETSEWEAYVEGDVYGVVIEERAITFTETRSTEGALLNSDEDETWYEVDSCWGFYGHGYAVESAKDTLGYYAPKAAA